MCDFFFTNMCFKHVYVSLLVIRMSKVSKVAKEEEEHIDNGGQERSLLSGGREKSSQLYNVG